MKNRRNLIVSIFQIVIGILAVAAFIIAALDDENMTKWIITLILAVSYVVLGIMGLIAYKTNK